MFLQRGDSFALIGFSTAMCGSFKWQGDTCLSRAALSECGPSGEDLLFPWFLCSMIYSSHHVSVRSGLRAVHMCWYVRCCSAPPCGFNTWEGCFVICKCEMERGRWSRKNANWEVCMNRAAQNIIIAEDSLNQVGGKIRYCETIPVFQIVKLTFSAAVASERG